MKRMNEVILNVERFIGSVMLITVVLLVFISAILRLFRHPITWSVDLSQLLFIWISMIGADVVLKNKAHMGVDLIVRLFPRTVQNLLLLFSYSLCTGFLGFVIYWGIKLCISNFARKYATLKISYSFATLAVPFISVFMILTILEQFIDLIKNWNVPGKVAEKIEV